LELIQKEQQQRSRSYSKLDMKLLQIWPDLMLSRNFRNLAYSDSNDFSTHITIMYNKLAQVLRIEERSNK